VNDAMVVRADDHDISTNIQTTLRQILNMMSLGESDTVVWQKILAAYLAAILVVRLEAVGKEPIACKLLDIYHLHRSLTQDCNTIMIVDCRERTLLAKFLRYVVSRYQL
jgi:hypothetical protein